MQYWSDRQCHTIAVACDGAKYEIWSELMQNVDRFELILKCLDTDKLIYDKKVKQGKRR